MKSLLSRFQANRALLLTLVALLSIGFLAGAQDESATTASVDQPATPSVGEKSAEGLTILVVGAHPADVFDQCGGTMAHHVARGDRVYCAVMTTGVRVHDKVISDDMEHAVSVPEAEKLNAMMEERSKVKQAEVVKACGILGIRESDVFFLGADDAVLLVNEPMIRKIARLIRTLRPDILLTHLPNENGGYGSAHATTGQIVMYAKSFAGGVDPGDTNPPHKVTQVFFFGQGSAAERTHLSSSEGGFYNDVFVDITDMAEKKVACFDALESQGYNGPYARKRIETCDGAFGRQIGMAYAEGFISLYSTRHYYLPISPEDLKHSRMSNHEVIDKRSHRINVP
ncbi:PIG-L deacetylase family protein [Aeoliella sp.]|uniref:PIG-L deacetylase family protein n=1 Tax=Aeoliella sp. TaxID=2795800 RepID=UPI003CCBAD94